MESPQKENGFTPIANEIMEALAKHRIPGEQRQVLDIILRRTYGWKKKEDAISLKQFVEGTGGMKKASICRAISGLQDRNLVHVSKNANKLASTYQFNKYYSTWKTISKKANVSKKANETLAKKLPSKEIYKRKKEYTASDDAEHEYFLTKKKKKMNGKRLESFTRFWDAFNYKKGKAEAADAWLDIPQLTQSIVDQIVQAAKLESKNRPAIIASGKTPKMAQGWITGRRWEDEETEKQPVKEYVDL